VYLLQEAGCPLNVDYTLHHYGPYSPDVAQRADAMVQAGLLCEQAASNSMRGRSFSYELSEPARNQLARVGRDPVIQQRHAEFDRFEPLAQRLLREPDLKKLEFAATIAYFRNHVPGEAWPAAREAAAAFKKQEPDSQVMTDAESFARQVLEREDPD
jgi:uncharacterized protein YwgA